MVTNRLEVTGIASGDGECWCLLVTREDFVRIMKREPEEWDTAPSGKDQRYSVYPTALVGDIDGMVSLVIEATPF